MSESEKFYLIVMAVLVVFCIAVFIIACSTAPNGNVNGAPSRWRGIKTSDTDLADLRMVLRGFDEGIFVAHLTAKRLGYLDAIDRLKVTYLNGKFKTAER